MKSAMKALLLLICLGLSGQQSHAESLVVSYMPRPPYYDTVNGNATGFLIELTRKILDDAKIQYAFEELPNKRIMHEIQEAKSYHCSVGWFKKPEREEFALFSLPIYQDKPMVILTTKANEKAIRAYSTLEALFGDKSLKIALTDGFSYGTFIDDLIKKTNPDSYLLVGKQAQMPKMIEGERVSYMLIAPEEVEMILASANVESKNFVTINMSDIPIGNKRYLMFSKTVGEQVVNNVNESIKKFVDKEILQ